MADAISRRQLLALAAGLSACRPAAEPLPAPNIVLILADDLGYGDLGCFGSAHIQTPNLDRLAAEGIRLTNHYVCAPVCSPSRAGLLTGRYPQRLGVQGVLRDHHDETGLDLSEQTLADVLRSAGYETALVGKWHLGVGEAYWPRQRGFDHFYGFLNGTIDYYTHLSRGGGLRGQPVAYRNETPIREQGYFPERIYEEAVRFVETDRVKPFFLYLSLALPHEPLQAPDRWKALYADLEDQDKATYAAMVSCLDDGVGQVLTALEGKGIADDTMVVFLSDHGWRIRDGRGAGDNGPFSGGKYELTEGGLRTPTIVRWPSRVAAGSVNEAPSITLDWLPTLAEVAGVVEPPRKPLDGASILATLEGRTASSQERTFFWAFRDDQTGTPQSYAVRRGRWKYLQVGEEERLTDLETDLAEAVDFAAEQPGVLRDLREALEIWRAQVGEPEWVSAPLA